MKYLNFPLGKTYSRLGDLSFSMAAARVWNLLPIFITILKVNLKPIILNLHITNLF